MRTDIRFNMGFDDKTPSPARRWGGSESDIPLLELEGERGSAVQFWMGTEEARQRAVDWLRTMAREAAALANEIDDRFGHLDDDGDDPTQSLVDDQIEAACRELAAGPWNADQVERAS